jgi:hypothetical protein
MSKIELDKYYTPDNLAEYCVSKTNEIIGKENIKEYLEPSAGAGSFLPYLNNNYIAFDIKPEGENIEKSDYLKLELPYIKGRCTIGNPPFGKNTLALQFMRKAIKEGDYIAYILPVSQFNNNYQLFEFDLIYSEILPEVKYSGRVVKCCFNIYKRPNGKLNKKPNYKLKDVEIFEYRRNEKQVPYIKYDYRMCSYGSSIGVKCTKPDRYVKEICIIINKHKDKVIECLDSAEWKMIVPPTTTPSLPQWQVYKYLKEQVTELE